MTDLTVVLVADSDVGRRIQHTAEAWAVAGVLRPSVWVTPDQIDEPQAGPPLVRATQLTEEGSRVDDLFTLIGVHRLRWVRLVVVHLGTPDEDEAALVRAGQQLDRTLRETLPLGTSSTERGTQLHRVKLLVPASGTRGLSPEVLQPEWEVNAVASPEDRPDVDRGSVFVRPDRNYVGHALNAVCAVGALWNGIREGALDEISSDSSSGQGGLYVFRPTVRAVLGKDRVAHLAQETMQAVAEADIATFVDWARRAPSPAVVSQRTAQRLLETPNWASPEPVYPVRTPGSRHAPGSMLRAAATYNARMFGAGFRWVARRGQHSAEEMLTDRLVGGGTEITIAFRPQSPESLQEIGAQELKDTEQTVGAMIESEGWSHDLPLPETWRDLRRLTFGLLDGGDLPGGIRTEGSGRLVEVVPNRYGVPPPDDVAVFGTGSIGIVDAIAHRSAVAEMTTNVKRAQQELEAVASAAQAKAPTTDSQNATPPPPTGAPVDGPSQTPTKAVPQASSAVDQAREHLRVLEEQLNNARGWEARRSKSLLWLVADDVGRRLHQARARRQELEEAQAPTTQLAMDDLRRAFARLTSTWRLSAGVGALVLLGLAAALFLGSMSLPDFLVSAGVVWVAMVVAIAVANHSYFKADLRYRKDFHEAMWLRRSMAEELVNLRHTVGSLEVRYEGLMLWAAIISQIVYHPWGPVQHSDSALSAEEISLLPAAVALAQEDADPERVPFGRHVVLSAVNVLHTREHLSRRFEDLLEDFARDQDHPTTTAANLVDNDDLLTEASPRRQLLDYLRGGTGPDRATDRAVAQLSAAVEEDTIRLPDLQVRRLGPFSDGRTVTESEFYRASLRVATPLTMDQWSPEGQVQSKHMLASSLAWMPPGGAASARAGLEVRKAGGKTALRVDLSSRSAVEHLAIFAERQQDQAPPLWDSEDVGRFN